ncbi:MAG: VOC family protein, partial [Armatimonadetes bacterium]|nr:VOC family protein [Armatimonadota bacterium]
LEPTREDSPVGRFLSQRGEGVHHVAIEVQDVAAILARSRAAGFRLVDEAPRSGAGGTRVAFLHPRSTQGVLIEFVERTR